MDCFNGEIQCVLWFVWINCLQLLNYLDLQRLEVILGFLFLSTQGRMEPFTLESLPKTRKCLPAVQLFVDDVVFTTSGDIEFLCNISHTKMDLNHSFRKCSYCHLWWTFPCPLIIASIEHLSCVFEFCVPKPQVF